MFELRKFIMDTINAMYDNEPEYKVREKALGWYAKGVLNDTDLAEVEGHYTPVAETPVADDYGAVSEIGE